MDISEKVLHDNGLLTTVGEVGGTRDSAGERGQDGQFKRQAFLSERRTDYVGFMPKLTANHDTGQIHLLL